MKTHEKTEVTQLEEIHEYSRENILKAIRRLEETKQIITQTSVSTGGISGVEAVHTELRRLAVKTEERLICLKSVLILHKETKLTYHLLDELEIGEHLLVQLLLRTQPHISTDLAKILRLPSNQRYTALVETLNSETYSLKEIIVEKEEKDKRRQEAIDRSNQFVGPF